MVERLIESCCDECNAVMGYKEIGCPRPYMICPSCFEKQQATQASDQSDDSTGP